MSQGFVEKIKNFFGFNEEFDGDEDLVNNEFESSFNEQLNNNSSYEEPVEESSYRRRRANKTQNNNIIDFSSNPPSEMIVVEPNNYDDAIKVVSLLKSKVAVIISFVNSALSHEDTMHIIDFICGAVCAIDGNQKVIAPGVYLFTPGNICINSIDSEHPRTMDKSGSNLFLTVSDITLNKKLKSPIKVS